MTSGFTSPARARRLVLGRGAVSVGLRGSPLFGRSDRWSCNHRSPPSLLSSTLQGVSLHGESRNFASAYASVSRLRERPLHASLAMSDSVLRRARPERFKTIGLKHVEDDDRLSWKAVGLLTYMLTRPDDWAFRRSDITNRHTDGLAAVKSGLKELRAAGYLRTRPLPTGGWEWTVSDVPMSDDDWSRHFEKPKVENRPDGDPKVENPSDGNPAGGKSTPITDRSPYQEEGLDISSDQTELIPSVANGNGKPKADRDEFEKLWALARRGAKGKAWDQYRKAIAAGASAEAIHDARARYVAAASDLRFVAALERWLRDERWEEEVPEPEPEEKSFADLELERLEREGVV